VRTFNAAVVLVCSLVTLCAGCGYSMGRLHESRYKTIAVPTFRNRTFYRGFEVELTRAVIEMIESRTTMKVVNVRRDADTVLAGEILDYEPSVLTEDPNDVETELQVTLVTSIRWTKNPSGKELIYLPTFRETAEAALALGENLETARREAFRDIAERIVEQLESDW